MKVFERKGISVGSSNGVSTASFAPVGVCAVSRGLSGLEVIDQYRKELQKKDALDELKRLEKMKKYEI